MARFMNLLFSSGLALTLIGSSNAYAINPVAVQRRADFSVLSRIFQNYPRNLDEIKNEVNQVNSNIDYQNLSACISKHVQGNRLKNSAKYAGSLFESATIKNQPALIEARPVKILFDAHGVPEILELEVKSIPTLDITKLLGNSLDMSPYISITYYKRLDRGDYNFGNGDLIFYSKLEFDNKMQPVDYFEMPLLGSANSNSQAYLPSTAREQLDLLTTISTQEMVEEVCRQ